MGRNRRNLKEPSVGDLLRDPLVRQMMASDNVHEADLRGMLHLVARYLKVRSACATAAWSVGAPAFHGPAPARTEAPCTPGGVGQ